MPSMHERGRNNVRAGIFVTASLIVALLIVVALTDVVTTILRPADAHTVTFDVAAGVNNLKKGSDVRVGGWSLGQVVEVVPRVEPGQALEIIDVTFKLDRTVTLYEGARILVGSSLIGADAWLEIPDVGDAKVGPAPDPIPGSVSAGMLQTVLGPNADRVVENTVKFTDFLGEVPDEYDREVQPAISDIRELVADVRDVRWDRWAGNVDRWSETVDEIMAWADDVTVKLDEAVASGNGMFTDGREILAENREGVKATVENAEAGTADFRELAEKLEGETLDRVHAILDRGQDGMDNAVAVLETVRQDYGAWAGDVAETLGNANLMSQQLKLMVAEVRRSPWKVLYRPSADELDHEMLYEAARSFAVASADLKAASASVDRVLTRYPDRINEDVMDRLRRNLTDSLGNYEVAQKQLFEILVFEETP